MLGHHEEELEAAHRARLQYPDRPSPVNLEIEALAALGRVDEIKQRLSDAISLPGQPQVGLMTTAVSELRSHGYRDAAIEMSDSLIAWFRSRPQDQSRTEENRRGLLFALRLAERWDEARPIAEELAAEFPDDLDYQGVLGISAARGGDRETALAISDWLENLDRPHLRGSNTLWQAGVAAALGDRQEAVNLIQAALSEGQRYFPLHLNFDLVEPLRDYPPFQELLKPKG